MTHELQTIDLQQVLAEQRIGETSAAALLEAFGAPFEEAGAILAEYQSITVTDENDTETMKLAREKRLALRKTRITVENKRKELKEESLRTGQAIDRVARFVKDTITPAEEHLQLQEDYAKIKQAERAAALKAERIEKLTPYTDDVSVYNLDGLTEAQFDDLLAKTKADHQAHLDAQRLAEEAAKAHAEAQRLEQEKIRLENEWLRREQAQQEAALREERDKRHALERADAERRAQAEQERADAEEAHRRAALAPDREKIMSFSNALEVVRREKLPAVESDQAKAVVALIDQMLLKMQNVIGEKAAQL